MQNSLFQKEEAQKLDLGLRGDDNTASTPRTLCAITCHDCKTPAELGGYAFRLVPVCSPCRTDEDVRILHKRIDRRSKK